MSRAAVLRLGRRARRTHCAAGSGRRRTALAVVPGQAGRVVACRWRLRVPRRRSPRTIDDRRVHGDGRGRHRRDVSRPRLGSRTVGTASTSGSSRRSTRWRRIVRRILHHRTCSRRSASPSSSAPSGWSWLRRVGRRASRSISSLVPRCSPRRTRRVCTPAATTTCCCRSTRRSRCCSPSACTAPCNCRGARGSARWRRSRALLQFGRLVYDPVAQVPSRTDVELGDETLAALRQLPQPIYLPGHPWYLAEIGQPTNAQSAAIGDVLRGGRVRRRSSMAQELWRIVADQRYGSIVVESAVGYSYLPTTCAATTSRRGPAGQRRGVVSDHRDDHRSGRGVVAARRPRRPRLPGRRPTGRSGSTGELNRVADVTALPPEGWAVVDGKLHRELEFHNFVEAFGFMAMVGLAGREGEPSPRLVELLQQGRDRPHVARQG